MNGSGESQNFLCGFKNKYKDKYIGGLTPAKGAIGAPVGRGLSMPPVGHLDLHHTHDGMKNKDVVKIQ